jgi:hypothetical protein
VMAGIFTGGKAPAREVRPSHVEDILLVHVSPVLRLPLRRPYGRRVSSGSFEKRQRGSSEGLEGAKDLSNHL